MSEFTAAADLEVRPTDDSLRRTRRIIEQELGDIEVDVTPNRPTGGGGGGAIGQTGPEPAGIDLQRRQLGGLETLNEKAEERNDLLQELLEEGLDEAGGGGLRAGAIGGLAARGTVGATGLGFGVLGAGAILGTLGLAQILGAEEGRERDRQTDVMGPSGGRTPVTLPDQPRVPTVGFNPFGPGQTGPPGIQRTMPPDRSPLAGGTKPESTTNIDATTNIDVDALNEADIRRIVERHQRQMANNLRRELEQMFERQFNAGTSPRGAGGGGRFRR